jgi:hypothetical protein
VRSPLKVTVYRVPFNNVQRGFTIIQDGCTSLAPAFVEN